MFRRRSACVASLRESLSAVAAARGGALGDVGNSIMLPEFGTPFDLLGTESENGDTNCC